VRALPDRRALTRVAVLAVIALAWLGSLGADRFAGDAPLLWGLAGGTGLLLIAAFVASSPRGWLSPGGAYLSVFWLFHFGFIFTVAFASDSVDALPDWARDMVFAPETTRSALLALLFMACVWLGADLAGSRARPPVDPDDEPRRAPRVVRVGWWVLAAGTGLSVLAIARVGLGTFFGAYDVFFEQSNDVFAAILVLTSGLYLLLDGGLPVRAVLGAAAFTYVPMAALCLVAGSRTAPMFSAVGLAVALRHRGVRISTTALAVAMVGAFVTIGALQQVRERGVSAAFSSGNRQVEGNPLLSGIVEMGGSLRAVSATLVWLEGRERFHGATYALPFIRLAQKIAGIEPLSPESDPRFINEQISQVFGPIGYSTVAEGYVNFGEWGVAVFALVWGLTLGTLGRWTSRTLGLALLGAFLVPMLINVRNSFIFVPGWIFIGVVPIALAYLVTPRRPPPVTVAPA
jgi:hypothetical protein